MPSGCDLYLTQSRDFTRRVRRRRPAPPNPDHRQLSIEEDDANALASRLSNRLERCGYRPTPQTTDFERAWQRRSAEADYVFYLTGPVSVGGRLPPQPGIEPPPPGPSHANLRLSLRVRSAERWSLPTYAEAVRAIPRLEFPLDGIHSVPPQIFKTLMHWPVASLRTDGSAETEICIGMPSPAIRLEKSLFPGELLKGVPDACLAAGYERAGPIRSKDGRSARFTKIEQNSPPGRLCASWVEVDEHMRSDNLTVTVGTQ